MLSAQDLAGLPPAFASILSQLSLYFEKYFNAKNFDLARDDRIENKRINEVIFKEKKVFFDISGKWLELDAPLLNAKLLNDFCVELGNLRKEKFSKDYPSLSTQLPSPYHRYRVQAFHEEVLYQSGIEICIRIPNDERYPLESFKLGELVKESGFDYEKIKELVKNKKNILVSGGTGSGKTSFLNALLSEVDIEERILTIEDSKELMVENKNRTEILISKQGRGFDYESALNGAMRARPDRIFLGEIDTKNTLTFLRLANTGHDGMVSTLHANEAYEAIQALITNSLFTANIQEETLRKFIRAGIDYIIQLKTFKEEKDNGEIVMSKGILEILDVKTDERILKLQNGIHR